MTSAPIEGNEKRPSGIALTVRVILLMIVLPSALIYLFRLLLP